MHFTQQYSSLHQGVAVPFSCFVKGDAMITELFTKKQATCLNNQTKKPQRATLKKKKTALGKNLVFSKEIFHQKPKAMVLIKAQREKERMSAMRPNQRGLQ